MTDPKQPMAQPRELLLADANDMIPRKLVNRTINALINAEALPLESLELLRDLARAESAFKTRERWQWVPKEPTGAMLAAWTQSESFDEAYRDMLVVAPIPPQTMAAQPAADDLSTIAFAMPGTEGGFTMATWQGKDVPAGTRVAPVAQADAQDAARYRWLRDADVGHDGKPFIAMFDRSTDQSPHIWADIADHVVDAAIAAQADGEKA